MTTLDDATAAAFSLDDRYRRRSGTVYLTGVQALVRALLDRARLDRAAGAHPLSYVTGYEGSPLAGFDLELARHRSLLERSGVVHQPAINEELAATAIAGTQLVRLVPDGSDHGVAGFWYGKAPGLDRATDALRHANLIGTDPRGGAVAFVGDDPAAKSSSVPSASELALADLGLPTFAPADPGEVLDHGQHALEVSRASGLWTALKVSTVVADGAMTTTLTEQWKPPVLDDLGTGLTAYAHRPTAKLIGAQLAELERSFHQTRLPIAMAYVRRSGVNRITGPAMAHIGIVVAGPTYLALKQALAVLELDEDSLANAGIRLLKLGVVFPLEPTVVKDFATGLRHVIVIEEKRPFLEDAIRNVLCGQTCPPTVYGKRGPNGTPLFSAAGELDADAIVWPLRRALAALDIPDLPSPPGPRQQLRVAPTIPSRTPYFCSGCPHSSSTQVAPGTLVGAGIGCHAMVLAMPRERVGEITGLTQMGGEGAQWIGMAPFVAQRHFVQNLGDGTFAHSGSLAIRAAIAAGVNITFKLLRNSAVAMTGGQHPVGALSLRQLVSLLEAEGVARIVVTSDEPRLARRQVGRGIDVRHRDELLEVQLELAAVNGVTVLIHDQECTAEKRRKRRRGKAAQPKERVVINERVCEGCGDCGTKSSCLSVQPVETDYGRKTRINQSSCNVDLACLDGDCPSFLTVTPGRHAARVVPTVTAPAEPVIRVGAAAFAMRITGVGGTGVMTVSQILSTAALIDGYHVRSLDQTGLAQKGGAVVSDLFVNTHTVERSPKLSSGTCDLYLGCDALVAADPTYLRVADSVRTTCVVSSSQVPTGPMVVDPSMRYPDHATIERLIRSAARDVHFLDASAHAVRHLSDEQYANLVLVGAAYQLGMLPMSASAIERAIELNGTAVDANLAAFRLGRGASAAGDAIENTREPADIDQILAVRHRELVAYQDVGYADRYRKIVERVRTCEAGIAEDLPLSRAVALNLFKLMAYKDEYEVARLSLDPHLSRDIEQHFGSGAKVTYRLHPPVLRALGMKHKLGFGPWSRPVLRLLVALRWVRGTPLDAFGRSRVRRVERDLIVEYRDAVETVLAHLEPESHELAVRIAELPDGVRGYEEIKLRAAADYRARLATLLTAYTEMTAANHPPRESGQV